ncbi:MAG: polysaccharide biosynthesis/export family protein, partial [Vulcanimicrobiaceae bacterium]
MLFANRSLSAALATLALIIGIALSQGQAPAQSLASGTVIHPGDQVAVQVFGDQTLTQNVTVLNDGTID